MDSIIKQMEDEYRPISITRGMHDTYAGMTLSVNDKIVTIDMIEYAKEIIEEFPEDVSKHTSTLAASYLFKTDDECEKLSHAMPVMFHKTVAKLLFLSKQGHPDIQLAITFLCTRMTKSDEDDWKKLTCLLQYLNATVDLTLALSVEHL